MQGCGRISIASDNSPTPMQFDNRLYQTAAARINAVSARFGILETSGVMPAHLLSVLYIFPRYCSHSLRLLFVSVCHFSKASAWGMSRSILGPLTATFTQPAPCTVPAIVDGGPSNIAFLAQGCSGATIQDAATCWPAITIEFPSAPFEGLGAYSPGLVCPSGYATACSAVYSSGGNQNLFQFALQASETAAGCCPTLVHP